MFTALNRTALALGGAFVWTALSFGAVTAPAAAQTGGAFYTAELAAPAAKTVNVAGGIVWKCDGTSCTGTKSTSRPVRACRELQRELGQVTAFTAKGEALEAELLERCNG